MKKKAIRLFKPSKTKKRIVSIALSLSILTGSLPMSYLADGFDILGRKLTVFAAGTGTAYSFSDLGTFKAYVIEYNNNPNAHKNDVLTFTFGGSSTNQEFNCDSIGQTSAAAFDGKIILGTGMQFNMVNSLFKYVTDDVEIVDSNGAVATMVFTRPRPGDNAPLFAENVIQSRSSGTPVEWKFEYTTYNSGTFKYTYNVAGFIGALGNNAKVKVSTVSFNNTGVGSDGVLTANIVSSSGGDAGLVCCTMGTGSQLEIDSIGSLSAESANKNYTITASGSGNAGGLVGSMASGSKLLLGNSLACFQAADATISAPNGYAGGIVGKCDGGVIGRPEATENTSQNSNAPVQPLPPTLSMMGIPTVNEDNTDSVDEPNETELPIENNDAADSDDSETAEDTPVASDDAEQDITQNENGASSEQTIDTESNSSASADNQIVESEAAEIPYVETTDDNLPQLYMNRYAAILANETSTADADYTVSQNITGASGSGGVAGYYKAVTDNSSENAAFSTDIVDLETGSFKVNGAGACGGVFGEVFNDGTDMTITVNGEVKPDHTVSTAASYGGLIGKYSASAQTLSLTVSGDETIEPHRTGGDATNYGGVIGIVDKNGTVSAYVKIYGINVDSKNANVGGFFGGVIARADEAFIELSAPNSGKNTISYSGIAADKNFAGVIGSLESGVLYLCDGTDLSGAATIASATTKSGQIVGYRNCGFVFAKSGWKLYRSTVGQKVDDIGSWGEVVRFDDTATTPKMKMTDVITLDATNHYVTIKAASNWDLNTTADFATTALNIQLNNGVNTNLIKFARTDHKSSNLLDGTKYIYFKADASIDLSATGIMGFTRDNSYGNNDTTSYLEYKSTATNALTNNATLTLAIGEPYGYIKDENAEGGERLVTANDAGCGKIYRHQYNGLFAKASGTTIKNITISSDSTINVEACVDNVNVGPVASCASGALTLDNVISNVTINHAGNKSNFYVGGVVGKVENKVTIGNTTSCSFTGNIQDNGNNSSAIVGGLIGCITADKFSNSSIKNTTISGNIKSTASTTDQKIGGLIGVIGGGSNQTIGNRTLTLHNVDVSGLNIEGNATNSCGGLLGYNWYKTEVTFGNGSTIKGVEVSSSTMKTTALNAAGLVYEASGWWKVQKGNSAGYQGIYITSAEIDAANAESFGVIINKGAYSNSAIYLEIAYNSYLITKTNNTSNLDTSKLNSDVDVYDELVAFSKFDDKDICENGQGVVSINVGDKLKMGSDDTNTGVTYQKQSDFTPTSYCNPNTRYYYNLNTYRTRTTNSDAEKFLMWSVWQYAHSSIQYCFPESGRYTSSAIGAADADLNMRGYSYYPVDVTGTVNISGNVKLYNSEFDATEDGTTCKRKSLGTDPVSQHYTMHNSLFRNVTGSLTATSLKLDGNVSIDDNRYCGALVMGTVESSNSAKPATVKVDGLTLNGIKINSPGSNYAPLLINKSGSNATFDIKDVKTGNTASATVYSNPASETVGSENPIIASSLMGDLGSSDATAVKVTFDSIKLDGRNASGAGTDSLNNVYYTNRSLFSRATLLNSLAYSDSSSYGRYYYEITKDWNGSTKVGNVTYGAEIVATEENKEEITPPTDPKTYRSKQNKYDGSNYYTHPTDSQASSQYGAFGTKYQNYVYTGYVPANNKHELRVNITSASFGGCGTYNDPYVIVSGENLETIAKIINGTWSGSFEISLPDTVTDLNQTIDWCEGSSDHHNTFTSFTKAENDTNRTNSKWKTAGNVELTDAAMAKYLAGAYYQISEDLTADITLSKDFAGFSNNVASNYVFHGVIDGNEKTIVNQSSNPLIVSSNGSVVRELTITVQPYESKKITTNSSSSKFVSTTGSGSCEFYGAVIGQILGGDNIIEKVSVGFAANANENMYVVDANSVSLAKLVPIGGYVGVIVNGGLIFKEMEGNTVSRTGITNEQLNGFGTDPLSSQDYLYINPIIGRVINGYAITERTAYHWSETAGERTDSNGVTMHNGRKNYSIADVKSDYTDTNKLTIAEVSSRNTVKLPNAQSMFILSLLTQSGMTANDFSGYKRNADYDEIGTSAVNTGDYASVSATYPYLVKNYVNTSSQASIATLTSSDNAYDFSLGGTDTTWYLPDGFRGIGSIGWNLTSDTDMNNCTFTLNRFSGKCNYGTGDKISINMNTDVRHYAADVDNYLPIKTSHGGLGLFNKFRQFDSDTTPTNSNPDKINDLKLAGKINYDVQGVTTYTSANVHKNAYLHVGGLAGCIGSGADTDIDEIRVDNIGIDGLEVNGFESAGGFFGYLLMANSENGAVNISNITSTAAFTITSKRYGGGLIGFFGQGNLNVNVVTIESPNVWSYYIGSSSDNQDFENGVGGIIGFAQNENNITDDDSITPCKAIELSEITIGVLNSSNSNRIGYYDYKTNPFTVNYTDTIVAGGIIGRSNTKPQSSSSEYSLKLDNCNVYNTNIYGHRIGGLIGSDTGGATTSDKKAWSKILIVNCSIKSDNGTSIIYGVPKFNKHRACGGIIGGIRTNGVTVDSCIVEGYTLQATNDTGGITANTEKGKLIIRNFTIKDVKIISNYSGSLVGYQNVDIVGYNILVDNVQFKPASGSSLSDNVGYIIGKNFNNGAHKVKIVGFSRQNTAPMSSYSVPNRMTGIGGGSSYGSGSSAKVSEYSYGGGYVIFSDYNGTASENGFNTAFSGNDSTNKLTAVDDSIYDESPYVMVNPKKAISNTQFFTGDGVSDKAYGTSAAKNIISHMDGGTDAKRYQSTGISDENLIMLKSLLPNKISSFTYELGKGNIPTDAAHYSGKDFPVLVIDDITNVDPIVKNYIRLLTNTSYTYNKGSDASVYTIDISKWKYIQANGVFEKQTGEAALKYDSSRSQYYILATEWDNVDYQISLIDVQFKDPSLSNGAIAYHLYIPVMVEKMLYYDVNFRPASGTTYQLDAYPDGETNLIENLGNPVTMRLTYSYDQSSSDWAKAINNGENVQRNYDKSIMLKVTHASGATGFPADAKIVLVDPNHNADKMYSADFSPSNTALLEQTATASEYTNYNLNLSGFTGFSVCTMNDLMQVSSDTTATTKNLVECSSSETPTVIINNPADANYGKRLRMKTGNETGVYAVKVTDWSGEAFTKVEEDYYLSIFTKANESDRTIYHYEFDSETSFGDVRYPSARMNEETSHILIGNLYNNEIITFTDNNTNTVISKSNNYLEATLTAEVGFRGDAIDSNIIGYIKENENVAIYQTFLVALQKIEDEATSLGIVLTPECSFEYSVNGTPIADKEKKECKDLGAYVEFPTSHSIKDALCTGALQWDSVNKNNEDDCKITISATVKMSYSQYELENLAKQFPESSGSDGNGTKMVVYSNISSSSTNGSASSESYTTLNDSAARRLYYMDNIKPVSLSYMVSANEEFLKNGKDGNENFGQLGINAQPDANEVAGGISSIHSLISFDASEYTLRKDAEYMKIEVELSAKADNGNYATALPIGTHFNTFKLLDASNNEITNGSPANTTLTKDQATHIYTYVIPLSAIKTMGAGSYEYEVPVNFEVFTGEGEDFQDKGLKYANYRVHVYVSLLNEEKEFLRGSREEDWIIYTNARIYRDIITDP